MKVRAGLNLGFIVGTLLLIGAASHAVSPQFLLEIGVVAHKHHIQLAWTADPLYCTYEVHRATSPHFVSQATTLQVVLGTGASSYIDYGAAHNVALNYFYVVRGIPCAGDPVVSQQAAEFDFSLVGSDGAAPLAYHTYGIDFSPYIALGEDPNKGDNQITDEELADRLGIIAPYTGWVRTFGCNNDLQEAGKFAHTMGLQAALGAWLGPETTPAQQQSNRDQVDCLKARLLAGEADAAIVGSEVLLRGDLSESQLLAYINEVKQFVQEHGLSVPVSYGDVYGELLGHPNIIAAVDFVYPNYYPYWEGKPVEYAIAHLHRWHQQLVAAAGGKEVIVSETGWPSCGNQVGAAVPSPANASFYFLDFVSWARAEGVKYFYFSALDEAWKAAPEGPQGACWGVWTGDGTLKPGMEAVFDGQVLVDDWTNPPPEAPIIDFFTLPTHTDTNLATFVVAGHADPGHTILLNDVPLPAAAVDPAGNFAYAAPLAPGHNTLLLSSVAGGETVASTAKEVYYDPAFSSANLRLLYIQSVNSEAAVPALPGTIVIDLDHSTLLGLIPDKFAVGIAPDGNEVYMTDRTVYSTATHAQIRTLPFSAAIPLNAFVVSPDGTRLYAQNQRLDVASNTLLASLPISIATGGMGPDISRDGKHIYCCDPIKVLDTETSTYITTTIWTTIQSDVAVTWPEDRIMTSSYAYAEGRFRLYDAATYTQLGMVGGLGDFTGEIGCAQDGRRVVLGSAGNPAWTGDGRLSVIDTDAMALRSQLTIPLADNLATSGQDEFFVSTGENDLFRRQGVDVFVLDSTDKLVRVKTFFLGINRWVQSTGIPRNDQIRKILFKP